MGMNPWPGVFDWYCNPVYRLFDFLLGYTGFLILNSFSWKLNQNITSIIQCGMMLFYFSVAHVFDKYWIPALYVFCAVMLIYTFTIPAGIFDRIFGNKISVHLGNISFELFILHQFVIKYMNAIVWKNVGNHASIVFIVLFIISWILAEFFYWSPAKRMLTKTIWGH